MQDTIHVKGLSQLGNVLETLPAKLQKNHMRGAVRAGMNEVKPQAQANVHSVSGELAKGMKVGTNSKGTMVTATLKVKGKHGFIARMLEFTGAVAHLIRPKDSKALEFGGKAFAAVHHPGFKAKPFLRPALDAKATEAVVATGNYLKNRLATKEGLDTSHITVEGDV